MLYETPRELASVVTAKYGVRLSPQETLLLYKLVCSTGCLVAYQCIEKFLWSDLTTPITARKIIHVLVSALRTKIPDLGAYCVNDKGYRVRLDWARGSDIKTD